MKKSDYEKLLLKEKVSDSLSAMELSVRYRLLLNSISKLENMNCNHDVRDDESYHYIPFPSSHFIDIILEGFFALGGVQSKKFLDVGCGMGITVLIASGLFDSCGFDYNPDLVGRARSFLGSSVFLDDARRFDRYGDFDFIYFYRPFSNDIMQLEFEERVFQQMKLGAIACPIWEVFDWPKHTAQVGQFLYQKVTA